MSSGGMALVKHIKTWPLWINGGGGGGGKGLKVVAVSAAEVGRAGCRGSFGGMEDSNGGGDGVVTMNAALVVEEVEVTTYSDRGGTWR